MYFSLVRHCDGESPLARSGIEFQLALQSGRLAPGSLFSLQKNAASKMRFNISRTLDGPALPALARVIETHGGTM